MIKYYNKIISSISEVNKSPTLLVHSLCGCNLKCYNCFNYEDIVLKKHKNIYTIHNIVEFLKLNSYMYEYLVISGGEFLINNLSDIENDLYSIREASEIKIILYTNGLFPAKLQYLLALKLIDGVHTDMKLPFHYINPCTDKEIILKTLGKNINRSNINDILKSIVFTVYYDNGLNQIRSVRYPFLESSVFEDNLKYINKLNVEYNKNTPYFVNNFFDRD